jgi:hypothetical protein
VGLRPIAFVLDGKSVAIAALFWLQQVCCIGPSSQTQVAAPLFEGAAQGELSAGNPPCMFVSPCIFLTKPCASLAGSEKGKDI